jgi:hypothetical protein
MKYPGWGHVLLPCKARSGPGINIILLFSLYLPAGRQVLNIVSILSKKWDFLYYSSYMERKLAYEGFT